MERGWAMVNLMNTEEVYRRRRIRHAEHMEAYWGRIEGEWQAFAEATNAGSRKAFLDLRRACRRLGRTDYVEFFKEGLHACKQRGRVNDPDAWHEFLQTGTVGEKDRPGEDNGTGIDCLQGGGSSISL